MRDSGRKTGYTKGSVMLEFSLTALPLIFIVISMVSLCVGMWEYHTVSEAVNATARAAAVHGAGCAGQTCATTVDATSRSLAAAAIGLPAASLNVTLTSSASTVTCNPLSSCYGNSAAWPSLAGNTAGSTDISIQATFSFSSPISLWVPGHAVPLLNAVTLGAKSRQAVVF
jgi:Flp pilus assembly protein TadG